MKHVMKFHIMKISTQMGKKAREAIIVMLETTGIIQSEQ